LNPKEREISGAGDNVIRLSIGLEHSDDIINDLKVSLDNL
jgi:cystathionine beta-lyase/cystathionine gamma-synthase